MRCSVQKQFALVPFGLTLSVATIYYLIFEGLNISSDAEKVSELCGETQ